jgi:hypothetical protein
MKEQGATVYDHELASVLRAIELGAREIGKAAPRPTAASMGTGTTYLDLLGRLLQVNRAAEAQAAPPAAGSLIVP